MNKAVKEFTKFYSLEELIEQEAHLPLEDCDITIPRVAEKANCHEQRASAMIKRWEAAGKVEYVGIRRREDGHKVRAWRLKA